LVVEALLLIAASIPVLYLGARWLVENAAEAGRRAGISALLIGLTVVAFGTSAPELAVSTLAATTGETDIAVANVLGSNIFNIGVVLAAGAILAPLVVRPRSLGPHAATLLITSLLFLALSADGSLAGLDGVLLLVSFGGLLAFAYITGKTGVMAKVVAETPGAVPVKGSGPARLVGGIAVGLGFLVLGAQALVTGAVDLASAAGVDSRVVGLTVVAAGTSLPELATSLVASHMKEDDIAIGNVVGSNLFNIAAILGVSALIAPLPVGGPALVDFAVMMGFTVAMLLFMRTGSRLTGRKGAALFVGYMAYLAWLLATL